MRILITALVLLLANAGMSQTKFFKLYTANGDEEAHGITELADSSYAVTGSSSSFLGGIGSQAFLMRTDKLGNFMWSKDYGGSESEVGRRIMHKPNDGYYIAGYTDSYGAGGFDYYLIKTDENGNLEWEKTYGGSGWERVNDAAFTKDTGIVMVGQTASNPTENEDMYIVRTDRNGDTLWTKTIGGAGNDVLQSIAVFRDSTFFAVGSVFVEDSARSFAFSMFFNQNGTIYWKDTLGLNEPDDLHFLSVCVDTIGNELSMVGYRTWADTTETDMLFARMTYTGAEIGYYSVEVFGDYSAREITTYGMPGRRYIGFYYENQFSFDDGVDLSIVPYTSALGGAGPGFEVNFPKADLINEMIPALDGGALAVGRTNAEGVGVNHAWVAKIGPSDDYPNADTPLIIETIVSVDEPELNDYLLVYPNPSNGEMNIESTINDQIQVEIVSLLGQEMIRVKMSGQVTLDLSAYPSGQYLLMTTTSNGISNVRNISVQH